MGTTTPHLTSHTVEGLLDEILRDGAIRSMLQPIVDLDSEAVVGYEALSRGPEGSSLEQPEDLFAAARAAGRTTELDWACRAAVLETALAGGPSPPLTLFINVEPDAMGIPCPRAFLDVFERAQSELSVVVEVTERALVAQPAEVIADVGWFRELGWGIALDDIGATRHSLALMPFLRPDVLKLDLNLVHQWPAEWIARIVNAVRAEAERTGATVIAEGIEADRHAGAAVAMGARFGQGWRFGHPEPPPPPPARALADLGGRTRPIEPSGLTPVAVIERSKELRVASKENLLAISRHLENEARALGETAVLLGTFQTSDHFTPDTRRRYEEIARSAALVAAFGVGMGAEPAPGVRGAAFSDNDDLVGEWVVAVVSPHLVGMLAARDLGDAGRDRDRRFAFAVTYDRDDVVAAATTLLSRVAAERGEAA